MVYLYFEDSNGDFRFVCKCEEEEVGAQITEYIHSINPNFKIYYMRSWADEKGGITYDIGSHAEFFHTYTGLLADR